MRDKRSIHLVVSDNGDRPLRIGQTQGVVCASLGFLPLLSAGDSGSLKKAPAGCAVPLNAFANISIAQMRKLVNCFFAQIPRRNFDSRICPKGFVFPKRTKCGFLSFRHLADVRTCLHKKYMWIFEHNFVADKAKIRRRAVARQVFFTQDAAKFAEKTRVYACEDRFLLLCHASLRLQPAVDAAAKVLAIEVVLSG